MKFLFSLMLGAVTVVLLMTGMSRLVDAKALGEPRAETPEYSEVTVDDKVLEKLRQPKSKKPEQSQNASAAPTQSPTKPAVVTAKAQPTVALQRFGTEPMNTESIALPSLVETGTPASAELNAQYRVEPKYPMKAALKGLEGFVKLGFVVDALGNVSSIKVLESRPKRVFDKAAIDAVSQWKFASSQRGAMQQITLEFKLDS